MTDRKKVQRSEFLSLRRSMNPHDIAAKSAALCAHLSAWLGRQGPLTQIFFFKAVQQEPELMPLIEALAGKLRLGLPVCGGRGEMAFYAWRPGDPLQQNRFQIPEPLPQKSSVLSPDEKTVLLVPCLAADLSGNRLGYGAGFYDQYLSTYRRGIKVGIVWQQFLKIAPLEVGGRDIKMDYLASEQGITFI